MARKATTEQRIFRGEHKSQFAIFPNSMWEDETISIEAKGLLGYVGSRPPRWHVRLNQLAKALNIGRDKLRRLVRELIAAGYVERSQSRNGKVFGRMDYWVYTQPCVASLSQTAFQSTDFPSTDFPSTEKPSALVRKNFIKEDSYQITSSSKGGGAETRTPAQAAPPKGLGNERAVRREHASVVQSRIANRMGAGNAANGWLVFGALTDTQRDELTALERDGRLTDQHLGQVALQLKERAQA